MDSSIKKLRDVRSGMIRRCYEPSHNSYRHYGARGIRVCERWLASFDNFIEDMGPRPVSTSLDRINNDGNYEPSNCRWATYAQQNEGRRNTRNLSYQGETKSMGAWARELNLSLQMIHYRITKMGLSPELAFTVPAKHGNRKNTFREDIK